MLLTRLDSERFMGLRKSSVVNLFKYEICGVSGSLYILLVVTDACLEKKNSVIYILSLAFFSPSLPPKKKN